MMDLDFSSKDRQCSLSCWSDAVDNLKLHGMQELEEEGMGVHGLPNF